MPIYVYKNLTTGETFEIEQRITEDALTEHPETGDPVKRLIQPVGIAFKGSGFYVTDSRKASNGASRPATSEGSSGGNGVGGDASPAASAGSTAGEASSGDSSSKASGTSGGASKKASGSSTASSTKS